ncbi:MAG: hypothetical protein JWN02_1654, partial [Acidobacteria bacterium]|nr:hypothetical protein [Acidobacteriota bacterium]
MATLLFFLLTFLVAAGWNALFRPVPWRIVLLLWGAVALWQGETLFSSKVDAPAGLAFHVYPWKALGRETVRANTGIALTEMLPWTMAARDALKGGEAPLWNRRLGGGSPLLSDQQNAIFHPFTLAGLWLPIGKAWTLSVALRLWFALFFLFVLLRSWELGDLAVLFGTFAYTFSTFHIVWLTISVALSILSLPMALAAADELLRRPAVRSYLLLVAALMMTVLSGHPESVLFVALTTGAYALFVTVVLRSGWRRLLLAATAALAAMLLTAFFWYPTLALLPLTDRYKLMGEVRFRPPEHRLGVRSLMLLVAPDIFGTVPGGTYEPPAAPVADLLTDYGELASAYAGLATLALALAALPLLRRRPLARFALGLMLLSFAFMTEPPGWLWLMRRLPMFDAALLQRWRFAWSLGAAILAALAVDALMRGDLPRRQLLISVAVVALLFALVITGGLPALLARHPSAFELVQLLAPAGVLLAVALAFWRLPPRPAAMATIALTFAELMLVTWRFNPPARAEDLLPATGAIRVMQADREPHRIVALGWSLIPDTPGFYGLEDVKTTDPLSSPQYLRLVRGYFDMAYDWDMTVRATHYPFCDFMNVRYLYTPPGSAPLRDDVREIYRGADGSVWRNDHALPRYFLVPRFEVEPSFANTVAKLKGVADFRQTAFVDHIPPHVRDAAPAFAAAADLGPVSSGGGEVRLVRYRSATTELDVDSRGWSLLVSSDTWWPGWRVYWNDIRLPPVKVNGAFVGVFVPPGHGRVLLRYRPAE